MHTHSWLPHLYLLAGLWWEAAAHTPACITLFIGPCAFQQEPRSTDVNQTVTAFCRKKESWCKEQGRQGRQGPLLGSQSADVQDPGLWHEGVSGGPLPLGSLLLATWGGHYRKAWSMCQHCCKRGMYNLQEEHPVWARGTQPSSKATSHVVHGNCSC